jgi:Flp pilus assembly protein TadD
LHEASDALNPSQKEELRQLAGKFPDSIALLKQYSSWWLKENKPHVAGIYAETIAKQEQSAQAWAIAGAILHRGINLSDASDVSRKYCADQAKKAFENAISLEPEQAEHRVNLALVYADAPTDNPMQAVLMLRDLEAKYPENPSVYNALGRLAIKTNQWDRALQRLEKAISIDPDNQNTICLLAVAYEGAGNTEKASTWAAKCKGN